MRDVIAVLPFIDSSPLVAIGKKWYSNVSFVDVVGLEEGLDTLCSASELEFSHVGIIARIRKAEAEGYRAAVITCFGDPALTAARENVSIPVFGPGETSLAVAATLGDRILIVEPDLEFVYPTERNVRLCGYSDKVVGVHAIDVDCCFEYLSAEQAATAAEKCVEAVKQTRAHVLIMGDVGFCGLVGQVRRAIADSGLSCPVIEPGITVMEYARMMLNLGLNQSRDVFRSLRNATSAGRG